MTYDAEYHDLQAEKYRRVSLALGHEHRAAYLRKAEYHEDEAAKLRATPPVVDSPVQKSTYSAPILTPGQLPAEAGPEVYMRLAELFRAKPGEYWGSRARLFEIRALKVRGDDLPPIGYDSASGWQYAYFSWHYGPPPESTPTAPLAAPEAVKLPPGLGLAVLADKRPRITRAFSVWLMGRNSQGWQYRDDLVTLIAEKSGYQARTVEGWIEAGEGLFYDAGRKNNRDVLSFRRIDRIRDVYRIDRPGREIMVPVANLLGRLQLLRATLNHGFTNGREKVIIARATIKSISGVSERTQRNYDAALGTKISKSYYTNRFVDTPDGAKRRRGPNEYTAIFSARYGPDNQRRFTSDTSDTNVMRNPFNSGTDDNRSKRRFWFDNARSAAEAMERRTNAGESGFLANVLRDDVKPGVHSLVCRWYGVE